MFENVRFMKRDQLSLSLGLALAACSGYADDGPLDGALGQRSQAVNLSSAQQICSEDPRVELGMVSEDVCVGAELFFRDDFGGNGRSCGSCHPADNNYTIDHDFIAQLPASDPLFVAEQVPALEDLERSDLLRGFGLILENVDGAENPTEKFTLRSVPHCLSLATSIAAPPGLPTEPLERTGWSGDGAPNQGRLKDFQSGAIFQHYTLSLERLVNLDFVPATEAELDAIDAFLKSVGRTSDISLGVVTLTDAGAAAGLQDFSLPASRCNTCHGNAGANLGVINQNFDTGVETLRIAELNTQGIPVDGGAGRSERDSDGDGDIDSFGNGQFNTPPLIEAADTGPFFHTNAFETIEDAVEFYNTSAFNQSPAGQFGQIALAPTQVANIGRFLRVINAAFNAQMAIARVEAALAIIEEHVNQSRELQQELLRLALVEVEDALAVLGAKVALNLASQGHLASARGFLQMASTHASHTQRRLGAEDALAELISANASLGTGMDFTLGAGSVMF